VQNQEITLHVIYPI